MKYLWFVLFPFAWVALKAITIAKNTPTFFYNLGHAKKRRYWSPVDWIMNDDFHPRFKGEYSQEDIYE